MFHMCHTGYSLTTILDVELQFMHIFQNFSVDLSGIQGAKFHVSL